MKLDFRLLDFKRIAIIAIVVSTIDGLQSFYLQQVSINPYQELNSLPLDFFRYGFVGYIAYIPLESIVNFVLLSSLWVLSLIVIRAKRNDKVFCL